MAAMEKGPEDQCKGDDPNIFVNSIKACVEDHIVGPPAKIRISSGFVLYRQRE